MSQSYLVQILLPKDTRRGEKIPKDWFDALLKELTDKFGGATSFVRALGQGLWWRSGGRTERDDIAVVEVMTEHLLPDYWHALRKRLETDFAQDEIVVRAQEIIPLRSARNRPLCRLFGVRTPNRRTPWAFSPRTSKR